MTTDELRESLLAAPKNGFARLTAEQRREMEEAWIQGAAAWYGAEGW